MGRRYRRKSSGFSMGNLHGVGTFAMMITAIAVGIIFLFLYGSNFGFPTEQATNLINALPWIFGFVVGIWFLSETGNPIFFPVGCMAIGMSIAFLLNSLYVQGIVTDDMLMGITIESTMFFVILIFSLLGAVGAILRRPEK